MSGIYLRPSHALDASKLGAMFTQAVTSREWKPRLHSAAQDIAHASEMIERGWITVAQDETGVITGFISRHGTYGHALFVAEAYQGAGVGRALVDDAKSKVPSLDLWTFVANHRALQFYDRAGFKEVERTDGTGNEEQLPDVHLRWHKSKTAEKPMHAAQSAQAKQHTLAETEDTYD